MPVLEIRTIGDSADTDLLIHALSLVGLRLVRAKRGYDTSKRPDAERAYIDVTRSDQRPTRPAPAAPVITAKDAGHVLWEHAAEGGIEPGGYIGALLDAADAADPDNLDRLALSHPGLIAAVRMAMHETDGIARLQAIAGGDR
jgi:hypothetical protein